MFRISDFLHVWDRCIQYSEVTVKEPSSYYKLSGLKLT